MNRRRRSLRLESLEMRRLLAVFVVTSTDDVVDANDTDTSLREAITSANASNGPDLIIFDSSRIGDSGEIDLALGQLEITDGLTIRGPQQGALRIDAQGNSRVLDYSAAFGDLTLESLTITGGRTVENDLSGSESGGAIRFASADRLLLREVTVSDSRSAGLAARGGGVFAQLGNVVLTRSAVIGNSTSGAVAGGGGVFLGAGALSVVDSTVSGNTTSGDDARGGGIYSVSGVVSLVNSSLTDNGTLGDRADGGGLYAPGGVSLDRSLVAGNSTTGFGSDAGAVFAGGSFTATRSDISFNHTEGDAAGGGAIRTENADVAIRHSSITNNQTSGQQAFGAGLYAELSDVTVVGSTISNNATGGSLSHGGGIAAIDASISIKSSTIAQNSSAGLGGGIVFIDQESNPMVIENSIVAANVDSQGAPDFQAPGSAQALAVRSSLIGDNAGTTLDEASTPDLAGNLVGDAAGGGIIDPKLQPLRLIGATRIHPLQPDSVAVDAGNNALATSGDQRGGPFVRIAGPGVDIGSYELQSIDPAWLVVTTSSDELEFSNSEVSLREAIAAANGSLGPDLISFDASAFANPTSIHLQLGQLVITDSLSIDGPGRQGLSIDAASNSRILTTAEGGIDVTVAGVALVDGATTSGEQSGGTIQFLSAGTLTLQDTLISGSHTLGDRAPGGAIYSRWGRVVLQRSAVTDSFTAGTDSRGGGVFSGGGLTMVDSAVAANATFGGGASGGGLFVSATSGIAVDMLRSTVAGNDVVDADAMGGGVAVGRGAIRIANSTISQNTAAGDGGGVVLSGDAGGGRHRIVSSTIAMNASGGVGGGLNAQPETKIPLTIYNTIVAGNHDSGASPDLKLSTQAGELLIESSLIGDNSGSGLAESQTPGFLGNIIGDPNGGGAIDPLLGQLAPRGGLTSSHSLLPGSPAIDAGDALLLGSLNTDQRGGAFVRQSGMRPDIGSFELQSSGDSVFVVNTAVDELDFSNTALSLREALALANDSAAGDVIRFDPATFSTFRSIDLTLGELSVTESVMVEGPGKELLAIDAQGGSRVLNIEADGAEVSLVGLTITGGLTTGDNAEMVGALETTHSGGGLRFVGDGSLTLNGVAVTGNRTTGSSAGGGGLFISDGSEISIIDSEVTNNSTSGIKAGGGGLSAWRTMVLIDGSRFAGNQTTGGDAVGGAIESRDGDLALDRSTLDQNSTTSALAAGGGLFFASGMLRVSHSTVQSNGSSGFISHGGGIAASQATALISHSAIVNNGISGDSASGGGLFLSDSTTAIINSTLSGNSSSGSGSSAGALFSGQTSTVRITNSTIADNTTAGDGGGILIAPGAQESLRVDNSIVADNSDSGTAPDLKPPTNPANFLLASTLIGDNAGTSLTEAQTADASGNLIGSAAGSGVINPLLGALAINGGSLPTHKPLAGSPVIDAGNDAAAVDVDSNPLVTDGRGAPFQRFVAAVDLGSFEVQPPREPIIEWSDPANIFAGTRLSDLQLSAVASTAGTFVYTPDIGAELSVGDGQTLMVQFTPDDTTHYAPASAVVSIDVVEQADLGDAPDSYHTLRASNGPSHLVGDLRLGTQIDAEVDGQPDTGADADSGDDGVSQISSLVADASSSTTAAFNVHASSRGMLDAWIDFDGNGVFDHPSEHIGGGASIRLTSQDNVVAITVPSGANAGPALARFRFSSAGGLLPTGAAPDGEVEDYLFDILDGSAGPTIDVIVRNGPSSLRAEAGELVVDRRGVELFRAPASAVGRFDITGHEFSNVFTIDTTGGAVIPADGLSFDGVDGVNTVRLVGAGNSIDLSRFGNVELRNIDVIDLADPSGSQLFVDSRAVRAMDPNGGGLIVIGDSSDEIDFVDGSEWRMEEPIEVVGIRLNIVSLADTFVQIDFGSPWQNRAQVADVNNDGIVTAGDALRILNEMARRRFSSNQTEELFDPSIISPWPDTYYDVTGDGLATALDALRVLNQLARQTDTLDFGEGERASLPVAAAAGTVPRLAEAPQSTGSAAIDTLDWPARSVAAASGQATPSTAFESGTCGEIADAATNAVSAVAASQAGESPAADRSLSAVDQLLADPFFVDQLALLARHGNSR